MTASLDKDVIFAVRHHCATLSRQWALLRQLPAAPRALPAPSWWRLRDVGFTVSKRTVERDLNELSLIFRWSAMTRAFRSAGTGRPVPWANCAR
jgi:hypothetical protein